MNAFDAPLRGFDRAIQNRMLQRLAFDKRALQNARNHSRVCEKAHQIVFQRNQKFRTPGIALAGTTAAQLAVDAARFVALRPEHVKAAELANAFAELNVGPAAGHVCCDCYRALLAGVSDDFGFDFVIFCVQNVVRNSGDFEAPRKQFRGFDARGSDENWLALFVRGGNFFYGFGVFFAARFENHVVFVDSNARLVCWDCDDSEPVNVVEFAGFCFCRSRHSRQFFVHSEIILNRDRRVSLCFFFDFDAFFRFDRLMKPVAPAAARHNSPRVFVHDHDFSVFDDVLDVFFEERVGAEKLRNAVNRLGNGDEFRFRVRLQFRSSFGVQVFPRVDPDKLRRQIRKHKRVGIVRPQRISSALRQIGFSAALVDRVKKFLFDSETSFPIKHVHHFGIEGVERFSPLSVFHHSQKLLVPRRAELDLEKRDQAFLLFFRSRLCDFQNLLRALNQSVTKPRLLFHEKRNARLEFAKRRLVVVAHRPRNNQRRARFIDQNRVNFVDNAVKMVVLDLLRRRSRHAVVSEIIESKFRRRSVSDVARIRFSAVTRRHRILDAANAQPEKFEEIAHPLGISPRQIIVHGNELAISARKRVQIKRKRRNKRLAFAGRHFRDFVLVKRNSAD